MSEAYAPDDAALRLTAVRSENGVNPLCLWARLMYVGGGISVFVKAVCSMLLLFTRSDLMRVLIRVAEVDLWGMIIFQSLVGYLDSDAEKRRKELELKRKQRVVAAAKALARGSVRIPVRGLSGASVEVPVELTQDTVGDLKLKVFGKDGVEPEAQQLVHEGVELADDAALLSDHGLSSASTVHLGVRELAVEEGPRVVLDRRMIARHYLKTAAPLDCMIAFPYDLLVQIYRTRHGTNSHLFSDLTWLQRVCVTGLFLIALVRVRLYLKEYAELREAAERARAVSEAAISV